MSQPQYAELDALYARLPAIKCKKRCAECCGPVFMSKAEWDRIKERLGCTPQGRPDLVCPMLDRRRGQCTVYDIRPAICRLWGLVKAMQCPWGCVPDEWLSDEQANAILMEAEVIGNPPDELIAHYAEGTTRGSRLRELKRTK